MIKLKSLLFESRKHGFDLTDFKNKGYQVVLKNLDIPPVSKKVHTVGSGKERIYQ